MPGSATPAASSQTKANNQGGLTAVTVNPPRQVTYLFSGVSSANLKIPYAVAVDGSTLPVYDKKPRRVSCSTGTKGRVTATVQQGQTVSLYLNSDAHPAFRQKPVYAVTAGERDVEVRIKEKYGKHTESDTPVQQIDPVAEKEAGKLADTYTASLTGDIWMKISHRYTEAEVAARTPAGTSAAVLDAIKSIYRGLTSAALTVTEPANTSKPACSLQVSFADSENPNSNISNYSLLADGLPRVHPAGYAALFSAALQHGIPSLLLSSCWRPLLGSIAHRAGLGLDVSVLGGTTLNRQELRRAFSGKNASQTGDGDDTDNVTDAEVIAFGEYEASIKAERVANAAARASEIALAVAKKTSDQEAIKAAEEQFKSDGELAPSASETRSKAQKRWNAERDAGEPAHARLFRISLLDCPSVKQLFDPWYMDGDTKDNRAPVANMQLGASTSNERLHAHHVHITVDDPRIL